MRRTNHALMASLALAASSMAGSEQTAAPPGTMEMEWPAPQPPHINNPEDKRPRRTRRAEIAQQKRQAKKGRKLVKRVDSVRDKLKELRAGQGVSLEDLHTEACYLVGLGHTVETIMRGA